MKLRFRESLIDDAADLAANLRDADRAELLAVLGPGDPAEQLADSISTSEVVTTFFTDDGVVAVMGAESVPEVSGVGFCWMLSTNLMETCRYEAITLSSVWVEVLLGRYPDGLVAFVDDRYELSKRWLKRLGFEFTELHPEYGAEKRPFWQVERYQWASPH